MASNIIDLSHYDTFWVLHAHFVEIIAIGPFRMDPRPASFLAKFVPLFLLLQEFLLTVLSFVFHEVNLGIALNHRRRLVSESIFRNFLCNFKTLGEINSLANASIC